MVFLWYLLFFCWKFLYFGFLFFLFTPLLLAFLTLIRHDSWRDDSFKSALYAGRVWHTRYLPLRHAFTYPLFMFCLDLKDEVEDQQLFSEILWPLSLIMNFQESDHLKNGEGKISTSDENEKQTGTKGNRLSQRVIRLISERTKHAFRPTLETHRVLLVTHLSYYGYCFNPVSFYYIQNRTTGRTDAVVGEVSNTPWIEMHCYVLHEKSIDDVSVSVLTGKAEAALVDEITQFSTDDHDDESACQINYVFPKAFHVSPFMEMHYKYDWTFSEMFSTTTTQTMTRSGTTALRISNPLPRLGTEKTTTTIHIVNDMRTSATPQNNELAFRARMKIDRKSMHPFCLAGYLATYPVYCMLIQIWIHYEALWLFLKGVIFQPHPHGHETLASRMIGAIMIPFFAIRDVLSRFYTTKLKEA